MQSSVLVSPETTAREADESDSLEGCDAVNLMDVTELSPSPKSTDKGYNAASEVKKMAFVLDCYF